MYVVGQLGVHLKLGRHYCGQCYHGFGANLRALDEAAIRPGSLGPQRALLVEDFSRWGHGIWTDRSLKGRGTLCVANQPLL